MRRRQSLGGRPPIPEELLVFRVTDWRELGQVDVMGTAAFRRWHEARRQWAIENGYTVQELWQARPKRVAVDRRYAHAPRADRGETP